MDFIEALESLNTGQMVRVRGTVARVTGVIVEAQGLSLPVGAECTIRTREGDLVVAEVI